MITEDYVSFETAKFLKEKGFDEHCFCINYPLPEGEHHSIILPNLINNSMIPFTDEYKFCRYKEDFITIPTLQMAMKWLREVHNIHIVIHPYTEMEGHNWSFIFDKFAYGCWQELGIYITDSWNTYEEACEVAIKYCLKNLI